MCPRRRRRVSSRVRPLGAGLRGRGGGGRRWDWAGSTDLLRPHDPACAVRAPTLAGVASFQRGHMKPRAARPSARSRRPPGAHPIRARHHDANRPVRPARATLAGLRCPVDAARTRRPIWWRKLLCAASGAWRCSPSWVHLSAGRGCHRRPSACSWIGLFLDRQLARQREQAALARYALLAGTAFAPHMSATDPFGQASAAAADFGDVRHPWRLLHGHGG